MYNIFSCIVELNYNYKGLWGDGLKVVLYYKKQLSLSIDEITSNET
jgi:hypothetical protein